MAIAGDIVIKLAADFAQFSSGMDASIKKLEQFGTAAAATNKNIDSFIGQVRGIAGAAAGLFAVDKIISWVNETAKAAEEQENLAKKLGFTADQIEAMQKNAKATGTTFEEQTKHFKTHRAELDAMTDAMKRQGDLMKGETRSAFADLSREVDYFFRVLGTWRAAMAGGTIDTTLNTITKMIRDAGAALAYFEVYKGSIASVRELMAIFTGAGGLVGVTAAERAAMHIQDLKTAALDAEVELQRAATALKKLQDQAGASAATSGGNVFRQQADAIARGQGANAAQQLADAQATLDKARAARDATGQAVKDAEAAVERAKKIQEDALKPPKVELPPKPTTGGGAGKTEDESIEAQIRRYQALGKVAENTYDTINKNRAQSIDDLQRELAVQQTVADIVEKFAAKKVTIDADQRKRLTEAVRLNAQQRSDNEKLLRDSENAAQLEIKMGDGTEARKKAQEDLNRMLATGRLHQLAYNRETVRGTEAMQEAERQARRYDDNLGSLAAGFESAAARFARSNDLFTVGEQAFAGLTTAISDSLDVLVGKSEKSFGDIAMAFAKMLADMALRAALSQVFKTVLNALGDGVGPITKVGSTITYGAAYGGPVEAGQTYTVGERGPETFIPSASGRIEPYSPSASGGDVTVNIDMAGSRTEGANDPTKAVEFGRKIQVAIKDVIQNEKRPGGMLYSRVTA